jgi:uncharacterized membrane protein
MNLMSRYHSSFSFLSFLLSVLTAVAVFRWGSSGGVITKLILSWNAGTWTYLVLMWGLMLLTPKETFARVAQENDERPSIILAVVALSTVASLIAILVTLEGNPVKTWYDYSLMISTILCSWLLLGTVYTLHYASMFYQNSEAVPILFPEQDDHFQPDYWDFIYFSFTISAALQTSDVMIKDSRVRRVVTSQTVVSFIFNTAILGIFLNVTSSLIGH